MHLGHPPAHSIRPHLRRGPRQSADDIRHDQQRAAMSPIGRATRPPRRHRWPGRRPRRWRRGTRGQAVPPPRPARSSRWPPHRRRRSGQSRVVSGDQAVGIRPAEDVELVLVEGQMPRERPFESVAGLEDDRVGALGRRHAPLPVGPGHAMRGNCRSSGSPGRMATGGRQHGDASLGGGPAQALQVRQDRPRPGDVEGARLLQEIALGVDIHEHKGSFQHRGILRFPGADPGWESFEKGNRFDSIILALKRRCLLEIRRPAEVVDPILLK